MERFVRRFKQIKQNQSVEKYSRFVKWKGLFKECLKCK